MPVVQVEAELSPDDLLKAADQLNTRELDQFVAQVIALQAQRKAPSLPREEADLLQRINQGLPEELSQRYDELIKKRRAAALAPEEHEELLRVSDQIEKLEAQRAVYLAELARLRRTTITALMNDLGIQSAGYV